MLLSLTHTPLPLRAQSSHSTTHTLSSVPSTSGTRSFGSVEIERAQSVCMKQIVKWCRHWRGGQKITRHKSQRLRVGYTPSIRALALSIAACKYAKPGVFRLHHSRVRRGRLAGCYEPTCQVLLFSYTLPHSLFPGATIKLRRVTGKNVP